MEVAPTVVIDLTPYGGEGSVILGRPRLSSLSYFKNEYGKRCKIVQKDGVKEMENCPAGDLEILQMLTFIHSAPFKKAKEPATIGAFLAYCDELDDKCPGSATAMYEAIYQATEKLQGEDESPFQD